MTAKMIPQRPTAMTTGNRRKPMQKKDRMKAAAMPINITIITVI